MSDVLVTGLPRSGSAVFAALLDGLPDAICLNSPPWQLAFAQKPLDILPYCKWLVGDFAWTRRQLQNQEPIEDFRTADGMPLLDGLYDPRRAKTPLGEADTVLLAAPDLSGQFTLGMRFHTLYTSILPAIVKFRHFRIIAVVRHPLHVLAAWQRLPQPMLAPGRPHGIARFWPEALAIANADIGPIDRLAQLYDAYIQRYHELREQITVIKYEDMIHDPMMVSRLFGKDILSPASAYITTQPRVYNKMEADLFREALHKYGLFTKFYYPEV